MTSYATVDNYQKAAGTGSNVEDAIIEGLLDTASRELDALLHIHPGDLAPTAAEARTFDVPGDGGRRLLYLREGAHAHAIRSVTAVTLNGADVAGVVSIRPRNETPGRALYREAGWPARGVVVVTGAWGWATTPGAAREWVVSTARRLRDIEIAGASGKVANFDDAIDYGSDQSWRIIRDLARTISRDVGLRR